MSRSQWLSPVPEGVANPAARQAGWQLSGPSEYSHLQQLKDRPTVVPSANLINIYNLLLTTCFSKFPENQP